MGSTLDHRRPAGRPRKLSREEIVEAAMGMIGEQGAEALGVRQLAARLGVTPPTLYQYFPGIDEIAAAVAESLCESLPGLEPDASRSLRTQMLDFLMAVYQRQIAHPMVLRHRIGSQPWRVMMRHGNRIVQVLDQVGSDPFATVIAIRALYGLVITSADLARDHDQADYTTLLIRELGRMPAQDRSALESAVPAPGVSFEDMTRRILESAIDRLLPELAASSST